MGATKIFVTCLAHYHRTSKALPCFHSSFWASWRRPLRGLHPPTSFRRLTRVNEGRSFLFQHRELWRVEPYVDFIYYLAVKMFPTNISPQKVFRSWSLVNIHPSKIFLKRSVAEESHKSNLTVNIHLFTTTKDGLRKIVPCASNSHHTFWLKIPSSFSKTPEAVDRVI